MEKNSLFSFFFSTRNALAICVLLYLAIPLNTFLNSPYPSGVDVATHLFQIGLIADEGLTPWNHWWYAGHPLLEQYPPLSHLSGALISSLVGVENAYKIVFTLIFMLFPISFFLLLKEFPFSDEQKAFALYFFSFSPVYSYYLQGGILSAMFAVPFAIFFLKFLARSLNSKNWLQPAVFSSISLALAALSHLFVPVAAGLFGFIYLISFKPDLKSVKRFAFIGFLSFCLVAFFWVPLALNYLIRGGSTDLFGSTPAQIAATAIAPFGRAFAVYINFISLIILALIAMLSLFFTYLDQKEKSRSYLAFLLLFSALTLGWVLFLPHSGQAGGKLALFLPIPFSLFLCRYFDYNRFAKFLSVALLFFLLISVSLVKPSKVPHGIYESASWAAGQTKNRALFMPRLFGLLNPFDSKANSDSTFYETYLFPHYFGKEVYEGWFGEAEPRPETQEIFFICSSRRGVGEIFSQISPFSRIIFETISQNCTISSPDKFCTILQEGAVDTVFANTNFPGVVAFADNSSCLKRTGSHDFLISYEVVGSQPYVDNNLVYAKESGTILIQIPGPYFGNLTVRESYYPYWKATLDSKEVEVKRSEYGYLSIPVSAGEGEHELKLVFTPNKYFGIFDAFSFFAWTFVLYSLFHPSFHKILPNSIRKAL